MDPNNLVGSLEILNAKHALKLSTQGSAAQRLSVLSGAGVAVGTKVRDRVTGQTVEVVSVGVVYLSSEVVNEVS